jgi:transcriptional antiterminator Rof (Rho-off)
MKLPLMFQRKKIVTFHLRSGVALSTRCRELTIRKDHDQSLSSYSFAGSDGNLFYVRLDDISAITVE